MAGESAAEAARRMREKSTRLARSAELWERGAAGERATADVLAGLPSDQWTVFHDLRWPGRPYANVDHVVVGPPGVFVIDSKNWSGAITSRGDMLRQNGRSRERSVTGAAEAASAVAAMTQQVQPPRAFPVICFVRDEAITGRIGGVMLCSSSNLAEMLLSRPPALDEATRRRLCRDLDAAFRGALDPGSRGSPPKRARRHHRKKFGSSLMARSISSLVVAAAVLTFVFSPAREALADWFVEAMRPGEAQEQSVADESTAPVPTKAAPSASRRGVAGTWVGSYRCRSKAAAGRLVIERVRGSRDEFRGVLHFGPTADDPATRRGSFRLRGTLDGRLLELKPTTWIEQPAGYISIGFRSMIPPGRFSLLEGDVTGGNCTTFSFSRR